MEDMKKIDICYSVEELEKIIDDEKYYCLYLAHKDNEGWEKSTSRVYMNNLINNFIYQPIDIKKNDFDSLKKIYEFTEEKGNILGINQTQPHKSNPVLKEYFKGSNLPTNVDAIIRNTKGELIPYDLNGPSFMSWYKDDVGSFEDKIVIVLGVGGVGEPLVRAIIKESPKKMFLVDPVDKNSLKDELSPQGNVEYFQKIDDINIEDLTDLVLINAAGKEGAEDQESVDIFLNQFKDKKYIFVDLRPHMEIPIVERASKLGWQAYTGHGMNARNDYVLVQKMTENIKVPVLSFKEFKEKVLRAS